MSANNYLWIRKVKHWWLISDVDKDTYKSHDVGETNTLEAAIRKANDYKARNEVEYGLEIDLTEEKKR